VLIMKLNRLAPLIAFAAASVATAQLADGGRVPVTDVRVLMIAALDSPTELASRKAAARAATTPPAGGAREPSKNAAPKPAAPPPAVDRASSF
jgi:hypothetical protein